MNQLRDQPITHAYRPGVGEVGPQRSRRRRVIVARLRNAARALVSGVVAAASLLAPFQELPTVAGFSAISELTGFDTCAAPSSATMDNWWLNSTYSNIGIYIGGGNRACSQPNLTSSWISHQNATGWGLLPIWVGRQMPYQSCSNNNWPGGQITLNTTTAYNEGYSEAQAALSAASALGMDTNNMPLIYDLEGYNGGTTCRNVAKYFLKGWAAYLAIAPAQKSGVYGSSCSSYLSDFASNGQPPDFIWGANWDLNPSTSTLACVPSGYWVNHQRHKQYKGPHNETHGSYTIYIDNDCSNGPVYYQLNTYGSTCL